MAKKSIYTLLFISILFTGCVGYDFPPRVFNWKPFRLIRTSEQIGRDQITNRFIVATKAYPMHGKFSNEVLSFLGQPQQIQVIENGISEDWLYIYYKPSLQERVDEKQGNFLVRFYHDKVIDIVRDVPT